MPTTDDQDRIEQQLIRDCDAIIGEPVEHPGEGTYRLRCFEGGREVRVVWVSTDGVVLMDRPVESSDSHVHLRLP